MAEIPTFSVAMATFNGERFLQQQLDSLAAQTHPPCELVAGDDGSTDGTLEILERFAKTAPFPVRIHRNQVNLGHGENFLRAADRCSGEWIAFCDQDDIWLANKIERLAAISLTDPAVDFIVTDNIRMDSALERKISQRFWLSGSLWMPQSSPVLIHAGHEMAFKRYLIELPWQERPILADGRRVNNDIWIGTLAWLTGKRKFSRERLTIYRRHEGAVTRRDEQGTLRHLLGASSKSEAVRTFFLERVRFWDAMAVWCREASCAAAQPLRKRLLGAVPKCEGVAAWYALRARIFARDGSRLSRACAIAELVRTGAYLNGFGLTPLIKDVVFGVLAAR